jgi:hypothetical protein
MRRTKPLPELPRIYVKPDLERREREAARAWFVATCSGDRKRPAPDTVDPLWLRLGLRANRIKQRAGWVVSSPILSDSLDRNPLEDPSLPGPGWLREVYRLHDGRTLCVLPRTRAAIEERLRPLREAEERVQQAMRKPAAGLAQSQQLELPL